MLEAAAKLLGVFTDDTQATAITAFDALPPVLFLHHNFSPISVPPARAKFMLIKVTAGAEEKIILRTVLPYLRHQNILDSVAAELRHQSLLDCMVEQQGGGLMVASPLLKKIVVGGSSFQFGVADHGQARDLLQQSLPDYHITIDTQLR